MVRAEGLVPLEWDVYCGPELEAPDMLSGWQKYEVTIGEVAAILHTSGEPVICLQGRAEIGPRALGNRSILASPATHEMKNVLNRVKDREPYRPVAPICMEEHAHQIFNPGSPDPYMLFDHRVREGWEEKVPAICHLDGTARLQTISQSQNALVYELLSEFKRLSGLPLLCNTSANYNGKGFFPDVKSVMEWGQVNFIWSKGYLYIKKGYEVFLQKETTASPKNEDQVILDL
jgi:carbamoyltransferase